MRREPFEPRVVIGVQPPLVVVDEHRCGDVHGVDEREAFSNATLLQGGLDLRGDVEKRPAPWRLEPKFLAIRLHSLPSRANDPSLALGANSDVAKARIAV